MIPIDIDWRIDKMGNILSLIGIADTHLLCDAEADNPYQPLDHDAFQYLKHCYDEVHANPQYYGKAISYTGGDLTDKEKSGDRKAKRKALNKNHSRTQDITDRKILHEDILPKLRHLVGSSKFIGGVSGNHLIEFCENGKWVNSDDYLIQHLGGKYCGEGKMLVNLHLRFGSQRSIKKIIITHGSKAGTKSAVIGELQRMFYQYGKIDLLIKCHAHDPMAHFHCRYDLPDSKTGMMKKHETLVMSLGGTREGEKIGADGGYPENGNYPPVASRFPIAVFHVWKPCHNKGSIDIKIRPIIL